MDLNYREIRATMKKAACYEALVSMLALIREDDLRLLNLPSSLMSDIHEALIDDDYAGKGVAAFLTHVGSSSLTYQDRVVIVQTLGVASHAILRGLAVTKYLFDSENILQALPLFKSINAIKPNAPALTVLENDAFDENMVQTMDYVSQYNRDIIDYTKRWTSSGRAGDVETPTDKPWWKDLFDYVNLGNLVD